MLRWLTTLMTRKDRTIDDQAAKAYVLTDAAADGSMYDSGCISAGQRR